MSLNFIQNLSDQVVRENHALKSELQRIRQKLKDYEWQMLEVIGTILPQPPLALAAEQIFAQFVRQVRLEINEHRQLKQHALRLRQQYEQLQREQLGYINSISQLKMTISLEQKKHQQAVNQIAQREQHALQQLEWQKEYASRITEQMSELKIEKMKLEEGKRRAIEDMRQTQNSLLVNFRQKNEEEHMRVQKQLRKELQMRDQTIKEMSSSLAALADVKNVQNSQQVLAGLFKSFQNYEQLISINAELKQQNQQLREQVKSLFNRIISIETETQQIKASQHNVRSQLERTFMQKQDLQRQLLLRMTDITKHQREKQAMELYYDQKWNSEYKKVKIKLETTYCAKFDELEREGKNKIAQLKATIKELIEEKEQYAQQVYQLTKKHRKEEQSKMALQKAIKHLQQEIKHLQQEIKDLRITKRQNRLMSAQEILTLKTMFSQLQSDLLQKIRQLMTNITQQLQKTRILQLQHSKQTLDLHRKYEKQLKEKDMVFAHQKQTMSQKYNSDMASLHRQIQEQVTYCQSIRSRVQKQLDIKLQQQKAIRIKELALKQQEMHALNERWIDKYCELQKLLLLSRKKHDQQLSFTSKQLGAVLKNEYVLHQQLQTQKEHINCLELQVKTLETQIQDKRIIISQKEGSIASLKKELHFARLQVQTLMTNRKQWQNELMELHRQFMKQFESLRKLNSKHVQHHRDKIRELQDLNHMKSLSRREMTKLKSINTERESLRSQIQLKETQNIILSQLKDYYQARLRDSESQLAQRDFRKTHAIMARRPKKSRLCNNEVASQRVLDSQERVFQKRRYAITSAQKHYNLSLSKGRLEQSSSKRGVQTISSLL